MFPPLVRDALLYRVSRGSIDDSRSVCVTVSTGACESSTTDDSRVLHGSQSIPGLGGTS